MKLTIFAASGGIGRQLLDQALAAGHDVTAVVHNPDRLPGGRFRTVAADLAAPDPFTALAGGRAHFLPESLVELAELVVTIHGGTARNGGKGV